MYSVICHLSQEYKVFQNGNFLPKKNLKFIWI
jgi:hypothetical protein